MFKRASKVKIEGRKRRALLLLLAAYADAGCDDPAANELVARIKDLNIGGFDGLLRLLEEAGLVTVDRDPGQRRRNRYALLL
jgi:DNA-binding transcriptional ArsR family regulator